MSVLNHSPRILRDKLILCLDAGAVQSYAGSGSNWDDIAGESFIRGGINGATFSAEGGAGGTKSFDFDGSNDYIDLLTPEILNFSGSTSPTVIAWIKTSSSAESQILRTSQSSKYLIFGIASGKLRAQIYDGTNNANDENNNGPTINDGDWHHVAAVFPRGGSITFYKDGAATTGVSMASVTGETGTPSPYAAIGRRPGSSQYFDGKITCVHVYSRPLSAKEIIKNYEAHKGRFGK